MRHYLEIKGLLNASLEEIKRAKREYTRLYQRAYKAQYGKVQLNLMLSKNDITHLKQRCLEMGIKKPTQYVLELIRKDQEGGGIRPNLLIDIEIALLTLLDHAQKTFADGNFNFTTIEQECKEILKLIGYDH